MKSNQHRQRTERLPSQIIEDETDSVEPLSILTSTNQVSLITEAQLTFDKGRALILQSSYIEATATLILSRDLLTRSTYQSR